MKILIASDKFKGSLTAREACDAIAAGLRESDRGGGHPVRCLPVADGGDGVARTLTENQQGRWRSQTVSGPLGQAVEAGYGIIDGGRTAVIEMAEASGLALLGSAPKDPWLASTAGTGELILDAIRQGVERVLLGIGGSATNDGGTGMAEALGYRFFDHRGNPVTGLPGALENAVRFEPPGGTRFPPVTVACDVENPLLGPKGATRVYGSQKGIAETDTERHEERFRHLIGLVGPSGVEAAQKAGAGAAGGLGFGALVFLQAELVPGFDLVAGVIGLGEAIDWADLVVTGEGRLDEQSLQGKAPCGVARLARERGKEVTAFCGASDGSKRLADLFGSVHEIRHPDWPIEKNMARGAERLRLAARAFADSRLRIEHPPGSPA